MLNQYFRAILTKNNHDNEEDITKITRNIPNILTRKHNQMLLKKITMAEVEEAVHSMPNGKAPSSDGLTTDFYKACWPLIKDKVYDLIEESRLKRSILKSFNATFLTLIPKYDKADSLDQFRPIALYNIIYRIISKVLVNRIKILLLLLISPHQTVYIEGRQILDNIILSQEVIHSLKDQSKLGMLIQMDMSKAFNKINWNYIRNMLAAFGFSKDIINWIMALVSGAFFSILLNGSPSAIINPSRGIRQGDPLSPFLFVIMAEGLGHSLSAASFDGRVSGLNLYPLNPESLTNNLWMIRSSWALPLSKKPLPSGPF